jgi:aspartate 1-decarboxylase
MLKSKIHRATVTATDLNYIGSITIDRELMKKADILADEKVLVLNINNGTRFETYVFAGESGSGEICLNGAAARLVQPEDKVIIISFGIYSEKELENFKSIVIHVNDKNEIIEV